MAGDGTTSWEVSSGPEDDIVFGGSVNEGDEITGRNNGISDGNPSKGRSGLEESSRIQSSDTVLTVGNSKESVCLEYDGRW
jgi:hypothetical protein